ncbi:uncharacterized protein LOC120330859 [Styela clava]|uniref:uncharacterized protein CG13380-like n=1 Tax=Styela clava TaxID=7725 RepID=UPI001939BDC5|nr:uncharacterized protein CG13380-like [Styela clava]
MCAKVSSRMAIRFKNPLMSGDCETENISANVCDDLPKLDYNQNLIQKTADNEDSSSLICNCDRPVSAVFCLKCGHIFTGRMRKICQRHPKVIHLMDSSHCPSCRGTALKEY